MLCLIYMHLPSGIVRIYQAKHSCLCYNLLTSVLALSCRCMHDLIPRLLHLLSILSLLYLHVPSFCLAIVFSTYLVYLPMAIAQCLFFYACLPFKPCLPTLAVCIMPTCYWYGCLPSGLVCYAYT